MRRFVVLAAMLAGLAAEAQGVSGYMALEDDFFWKTGTRAPLFAFASPTAFIGYPAYAGLPSTDGCKSAASVTGTKGEALTFTRATASSCCTATDCSTLEQCTSGQVCISPYTGGRGIRVNRGYTQQTLRTEELSNAAWLQNADNAARNTTVTADQVAAPDTTVTADKLDLIATTGAQISSRAQANPCGGSVGVNSTFSVWLKGVSGSGTLDVCYDTSCTACAFTTTWAQCVGANIGDTNITQVTLGNNSLQNGGVARPTQGVYAWGMNCTNTAYAMPYVKAVGAAVTVNAETAIFTTAAPQMPASFAATFTGSVVAPGAGGREYVMARTGAADYSAARSTTAAPTTLVCAANATTQTTTTIASGSRVACEVTSGGIKACIGGTCTAAAGSPSVSASGTAIYVGYDPDNASWQADGILGNLCLSATASECR